MTNACGYHTEAQARCAVQDRRKQGLVSRKRKMNKCDERKDMIGVSRLTGKVPGNAASKAETCVLGDTCAEYSEVSVSSEQVV